MENRVLLISALFLLVGCASNSGVAPLGPDTYLLSRQAATGFSGLASLKADCLREAAEFCSKENKYIKIVNTSESSPPYILGNYPRVEIQFMCLRKDDQSFTRPILEKAPDIVIERR